ncbi:Lrp/AsnC family transcriptional regulator [Stappia sp. ES.058]|uniref:Lrp/AsnC family transcriptional regulator n=1 Tax=Stappia sp. ES.058 TaxID=1881061 RepID=UPI00087DEAFB|nr:Lrp/AsnC family transcriptional regulator [Stappia sp. ES.058]SDU43256.1 Lrp/AsnC family transcriptional regulator [Stappia sp. ES.058]
MALDQIDCKILQLLQEDASISVAAISEAVNLTTTPCWRRIQRLESEGYFRGKVSLLNKEKINCSLTAFIIVRTTNHSIEWLQEFHDHVAGLPEVMEFHRLSGQIDYLIRVVVPDVKSYDIFYKKLISRVSINEISAMFSMEEIKSTTVLPLHFAVQKK